MTSGVHSQVSFGIKAGVSPTFSPKTNYTIANRKSPRNEFTFNIASVSSGLMFGAFVEKELDQSFFIRAEAIYNQFETTYDIRYTWGERTRSANVDTYIEKRKRLDIPVSIGARFGDFEISSGIVARMILSNENDMRQINGYEESLTPFQIGLQTGVGLSIMNVTFGLIYQMDFQNYAEHISINGDNLDLSNSPSRLTATIGYKF
jgi:hypothetical protein